MTDQSPVAGVPGSTAADYLRRVTAILELAGSAEAPTLARAAGAIADRLAAGGMIHTFGTGHSHMLAEEIFYRAGGLARVDPLLVDTLMLHRSAAASTELERRPGLAAALLEDHPMDPGDVLIVVSNSGGNTVAVELAGLARERGVLVLAVTSLGHAYSALAREVPGPRLPEVADIVLDTHGVPGDAVQPIPGLEQLVGPTSTVVGAALLQALVVEVVTTLVQRGVDPEVLASSNTRGGDDHNAELLARYRDRVRSL
jgi:uncharacterized phosphosugar-binding protein